MVTRSCGRVPSTRAETSCEVNPRADMPLGICKASTYVNFGNVLQQLCCQTYSCNSAVSDQSAMLHAVRSRETAVCFQARFPVQTLACSVMLLGAANSKSIRFLKSPKLSINVSLDEMKLSSSSIIQHIRHLEFETF